MDGILYMYIFTLNKQVGKHKNFNSNNGVIRMINRMILYGLQKNNIIESYPRSSLLDLNSKTYRVLIKAERCENFKYIRLVIKTSHYLFSFQNV